MKPCLLIVDDEQEIRESLQRFFRLQGYDCDAAADGREALDRLARKRYQVVVSDIVMPVMNGIDLLRGIRAEYPMTRTIMITGYVTLENALACMRQGAETLIFKPLEDMRELQEAVRRALQHLQGWQDRLRELQGMKPDAGRDR